MRDPSRILFAPRLFAPLLVATSLVATLVASLVASGCSETVAATPSGCEKCHRPSDGATAGIEVPHAKFALSCTDCHGGDDTQDTKELAHVAKPDTVSELRVLGVTPLATSEATYLRFRAPTHPAVVAQSCGSANAQGSAGAGCHQALIDSTALGMHSSLVGLITVPRFTHGNQPLRPPTTGVVATNNPAFQPATAARFTYGGVAGEVLPSLTGLMPGNVKPYVQHYDVKACTGCHLGTFGGGVEAGREDLYRGVGCAACHTPYAADGKSKSGNPLAVFDAPSHPATHVVDGEIESRTCEACHNSSARIGLSYRGWREVSTEVPAGERAQLVDAVAYGRAAGTYVVDEDTAAAGDETPPDVHQEAGMTCADCHVGTDMHGDSTIRANMGAEVGIECSDCHGTFDAVIAPGADGVFRTSRASPLTKLSQSGGKFSFTGGDGRVRPVTQVAELQEGLGRSAHNTARHGEMECYACHTAWMPNMLRARRTLDLRRDGVDPLSGATSPGVTSEVVELLTIDDFLLGQNVDGKIGTFQAQHGVYDVIASCDPAVEPDVCTLDAMTQRPGKRIVADYLGSSSEGRPGLAFWPVFAHTVRGIEGVRLCLDCHPKEDGSNVERVRGVYGFGTGEHMFVDGQRRRLDLTKLLTTAGTSTTALGHLLARPIPIERIQKALDVSVP